MSSTISTYTSALTSDPVSVEWLAPRTPALTARERALFPIASFVVVGEERLATRRQKWARMFPQACAVSAQEEKWARMFPRAVRTAA